MFLLLLAVIYLAFISLGLPDSLLGAAWPVMQQHFHVPLPYVGFVTMVISGNTIISSLLSERMTHRFGTRAVTVFSVFLTALALYGFSTVRSFPMLFVWAVPYGLGAGAIDAALNNYVALHYSSRHMSWLHCFWGVGTIISPYIMSYALTRATWEAGYRTVSAIQFGIVAVLLLSLPLWRVNASKSAAVKREKVLGLRGAFKIKGVPAVLIGFFAYCAAESTAMIWASSYFVKSRGVAEGTAAAYAALFFIGITAGRFAAGFAPSSLSDRSSIRIGVAAALCGAALIALPLSVDTAAIIGFVVLGLGCAPVYPAIIHATPDHFGAENSQAIIGIQMAAAYTGSTLMPPVFGAMASVLKMELLPFYIAGFLCVTVAMMECSYRGVCSKAPAVL